MIMMYEGVNLTYAQDKVQTTKPIFGYNVNEFSIVIVSSVYGGSESYSGKENEHLRKMRE
jgi:hypothetical protein